MKKGRIALCAAAVLLLGIGFYLRGGGPGIPVGKINAEQAKNVSWDAQDYQSMGPPTARPSMSVSCTGRTIPMPDTSFI